MKKLSIILVLAGLFLAGCGGERHPQTEVSQSAPVTVDVEKVEKKSGTGKVEFAGTVQSIVTTTVAGQTSGRVLSTRFEEGARVGKGEVLAEIDQEQAAAGAAQAEAALEEAKMALREVEKGHQAALAGQEMAEASAAVAASTFKRFEALLARESVSRQEFDEVEARHLSAQAAVEKARQSVLALEERKAQVEAKIKQAEAGLEQATLNLGYTEVKSPFDGIVVKKIAQAGQLAAPGVPLYVIEKSDYELRVPVSVTNSRNIEPGQEVSVAFSHLEQSLQGKVKEVVPVADPVSRTVQVKITLPDSPGIYSGLFGRAAFNLETPVSVSVPVSALVRRGQLTGVFVVGDENTARYRLVRTGDRFGSRVEILSGLAQGEPIVIDPSGVSEGVKLDIS